MNKVEPFHSNTAPQRSNMSGGIAEHKGDDGGEIDLSQMLRTLWRGKWWIAICIVLAVAISGYYAYFVATPVYSTTASVTLENRQQQVVDFENVVSGLAGDQTSINTEVQVLRSRELAKKLVLKLDLTNDPEFNRYLRPDTGFSVGKLRSYIKGLLTGSTQERQAPSDEQVLENTTSAVAAALSISNVRNSYVFRIRVTTEDPQKSRLMANTMADLYVLNQLDVKFEATQRATEWLSERVVDLQVDLEAAEAEVKEFNAQTELISAEALEGLNRQAKDTRERLKTTADRAETVALRIEQLNAAKQTGDRAAMARLLDNPTLNRSLARVEAGTMDGALFDAQFDQLHRSETLGLTRLEGQIDSLTQSLSTIEEQIERQSRDLVRLQQLSREAEAARSIYEYFLGRLKETSVQQGIQQADSRVLSQAVLPVSPSAPKKSSIMAMAFMLGLVVGSGIILLREMFSSTYRTSQQLELGTGLAVMGQIPRLPIRKRKSVIQHLREKPTSAAAEAIRNLRTSIMLSNVDKPPQVIMLTSSIPSEGKTTISLSLAQSFAGLNKRVLLIEGDLRRLVFSEYFSEKDYQTGLISVLSGQTTLQDAVRPIPEVGTDVLLGETIAENVADLFSSERFARLMQEVRANYDVIVIDTPPVLVVPDARTIAQHVDALLFAVRWDSTERAQVNEGLRMLASVNMRPSGAVLSQIDAKGMARYGYGGQYGAYARYGKKYYTT